MNPLQPRHEHATWPAYSFDDSLWPLLQVHYRGVPSGREYEEYLAAWEPYLRREEHVTLLDARQAHFVSAEQRKRRLEWMKANAQALRRSLGTAFVVSSPLIRLSLNIVYYFKPMQAPHIVVASPHLGARWAAERLQEAGLVEAAERVRHHFEPQAYRHAR